MTRRTLGIWAAATAAAALVALPAWAAIPATSTLEGLLTSGGGGPAADGNYNATFAIYAQASGGTAVWSESGTITAKGGQFVWQLGSAKPLSPTTLNLANGFLGVTVGSDPELPRQALGSALFAHRAAVAETIECSGCVKGSAIDSAVLQPYAKTSDLSVYAKSAGLAAVAASGSYTDLQNLPTLAAVAKSGAYGDLSGKPTLPQLGKACGTGLVLNGLKADGSLDCGPLNIPADYIDEISNGLIYNQFVDTTAGGVDVPILDGIGAGQKNDLVFPDIGLAQALWINVDLLNSDVSSLTIELYGPGIASPYILYAKGSSGQTLKTSFNKDTPIVAPSDINKDWLGKNPVGTWSIVVKDPLKNQLNSTTDGKFSWSIGIQTLSTKKIQIKGNLIVDGSLQVGGTSGGISGPVVFKDLVTFDNSWCPTQTSGERSVAASGVCSPGVGANMAWLTAVDFCAAKHADLCSGAQSLVLRHYGLLAGGYHPNSQQSSGNWIASYSDNDGQWHQESVGYVSDDQGAGNTIAAPCCFNYKTPARATDKVVKVNANDVGQRVVFIHDVADATFPYAAMFCAGLNADLCDKSQLVYLRNAGKITASPYWDRSGEDSDGTKEPGAGTNFPDDVTYHGSSLAFACCATELPDAAKSCPSGYTDTGGVCWNKVNNAGNVNWVNASADCAATGAHICSVAQSSVLRRKGIITASGNWTGSYNDCDGQCSGNYGIGNVGNDINYNSTYGYACCL